MSKYNWLKKMIRYIEYTVLGISGTVTIGTALFYIFVYPYLALFLYHKSPSFIVEGGFVIQGFVVLFGLLPAIIILHDWAWNKSTSIKHADKICSLRQ